MSNSLEELKPIARQKGLLVRELDDEVLVYDLERQKAHCLNKTAALLWRQCDGRTKVSDLGLAIQRLSGESMADDAVWFALNQLKRARLIDSVPVRESGISNLSRRDLIKKAGIAAAIALPLVTSIAAPTAVEAATCLPPNAVCSIPGQCCNGICIGGPPGICN